MRLYHSTFKDRKTNTTRHAEKLTCEFRDHRGHQRRLTLYRDRRASEAVGARIETLVSLRVAAVEPKPEMLEWLSGLDTRIRDALVEWEIIDPVRFAASRSLAEHLDSWRNALSSKGDDPTHAEREYGRAKLLLIDRCGFKTFQQIEPDTVRQAVQSIKTPAKKNPKFISPLTRNYYLRTVKGFCTWMVREGRALRNPLSCVQGASRKVVAAGVRHARRAMTEDELRRLLKAAAEGEEILGVPGPERALIYRLAVETGIRAKELHSLTRASFMLNGATSAVMLAAGATKNGRAATIPLKPGTVAILAQHFNGKSPAEPAFHLPRCDAMVDMVRADLDAAKIPHVDHAGRHVDFHALRHTFITNLANSGVHPKVAQDLARHSDINLTLSRYSHTVMDQRMDAVKRLPDLGAVTSGLEAQDGTAGEPSEGAQAKPDAKQAITQHATKAEEKLIIPRSQVRILPGPPLKTLPFPMKSPP